MASRAQLSPSAVVADGEAPTQTIASLGPGRVLGGRYRLDKRLAQGGMGTVFRATQLALGRHVAVKVLRPDYQVRRPRDFYRRFAVEARAAARLQHPHSVTVLDYGCEPDGTYYLVMEYLRGKTLAQLLAEVGPMAPERAVHVALQIGRAVQAAHATGIVHRDLKPANVMVLEWGEDAAHAGADFVKVLDFGLAKQFGAGTELLTRTGQFLGSPGYMAPEQISGAELDGRCDVYALGALLYQMLAGRPPFERASPHEIMRAHLAEPVPPLWVCGPGGVTVAVDVQTHIDMVGLQQRLEAVVRRALQKKPDDRFASVGKLLEALHRAIDATFETNAADASATTQGAEADGADFTVARAFFGPRPPQPAPLPVSVVSPMAVSAPLGPVGARTPAQAPRAAQRRRLKLPRARRRWAAAAWLGVVLSLGLQSGPSSGRPLDALLAPPNLPDPELAAPVAQHATAAPLGPSDATASYLVHLDSTPRGAQVFVLGQQVCAATPCATVLDAREPRVQLRFALRGHDDTLVAPRLPATVQHEGSMKLAVHARLQ